MARYPELAGRAALVTGAGSRGGIGECVAASLAQQGMAVACVDIDGEAAARLAEQIAERGGEALSITGDVTDDEQVRAAVHEVIATFGKIDVLVNNAGGFNQVASTDAIDVDEWRAVVELNLTGVFLCCRAVYRHMADRGSGHIVNLASVAGRPPTVAVPVHYAAAKAGVISLTQHLARELGPKGVNVNALAPGVTATPRVLSLRADDLEGSLLDSIPLGRLATTQDQADVILFLVSDGARYLTGVTIDSSGGLCMT